MQDNHRGHSWRPFLLTQPYVDEIPDELRTYARMHCLDIETSSMDGWYSEGTVPIRLTITGSWPLWPIERDAAVLLHTQPVKWPEGDSGAELDGE